MRRTFFTLATFVLALASSATAQSTVGTVSGTIRERGTERAIPGVQVRVVGTQRGAVTDGAGVYRIAGVPAGTVTLAAQLLGYTPQSRSVAVATEGATADFTLVPAVTTLDQVVVTATGQSERRRESGASTATIDATQITTAAISTFSDALSSRAPGVVVQTSAGESGAGTRVRIRGSNSISLSNEPLLIVDGVRLDNTPESSPIDVGGQFPSRLNDINPEEIESIEVVKGPAAAALYGTAAANGVIQITTKKGRAGKTRWEGFGEVGSLTDVNDYPANLRSYGHSSTGALRTNCSLFARTTGSCVAVDSTISNIPIKSSGILQTGNRRLMGVSVTGGADAITYFISSEYQKEQNVVPSNGLQRMNIRSNVRSQLHRTLDAQLNIGFINSELRRPQNDNNSYGVVSASMLGGAANCAPGEAANHASLCVGGTDSVSFGYYNRGYSPYDFFNIDVRQNVQRLTGGLTSNWTPTSWFAMNGTFGADINHRGDTQTLPPDRLEVDQPSTEGYRGVYNANIFNYTASLNATATWNAMPTLKLTTTAGTQYSDVGFHRTDAYGAKLLSGSTSLAGTAARFAVAELTNDIRTLGFLGREQLAWRDRLFLTGSVRTDKNSAFGANYSRVVYPSLSASWVASEEEFFPKIPALSQLRLRAAVGSAGQNPGYLAAEQYYRPTTSIIQGADVPAFTIGGAGNNSLKPEKSTERELGFDLSLLGDRVGLEYTHYNKLTKDALVNVNNAPSLGTSPNRFINVGKVRNWGDEVLLRAAVLQGRIARFDVTVNGSFTKNNLEDLGTDENGVAIPEFTGGFDATQIFRTGVPLGAYWTNSVSYSDANGDGLIGCPSGPGEADCEFSVSDEPEFLGTPFPKAEISIAPSLQVGWARLSATLDRRSGHKLYNLTGVYRNAIFANGVAVQQPDASNLKQQAAAQAAAVGFLGGFIEDAAFTKLREVALSLTLPARFAARAGAGSAVLTFAGRNLHTWTNYSGLDPEVNAGAQSNFSTADFLTAPNVRYFTARLALSF
ncbi:MAG TPA: SusC/RagA family TonB-linked outer membrane protein [Gemmatimonadaceae bacterium]|nr:SusC/RagA family TonB-linked outer membrane protein [Gemmatimonadaceae bacterium]